MIDALRTRAEPLAAISPESVDRRAADAYYNSAAAYLEAGDTTAAARAYGQFATRFPRDARASDARGFQVGLLRAAGDSAAVETELVRLCRGTPSDPSICAPPSTPISEAIRPDAIAARTSSAVRAPARRSSCAG